MAEQSMWKMPSGNWVQDDSKKRFFIVDRESGKVATNQLGLEITVGAKWHREGKSGCTGFFPQEFNNCPFCGSLLIGGANGNAWVPPYGRGNGLRLVSESIDVASIPIQRNKTDLWVEQDTDTFSLPRLKGDYEFIVGALGTRPSILIAFDRTTGLLDYFSPTQKKWVSLKQESAHRIGESRLPNWSWSVAVVSNMSGFAIPTNEGPVWIDIDWTRGKYTTMCGTGKAIGGIASLDRQVYVPVLDKESIAVLTFDFASLKWDQVGKPLKDMKIKSFEKLHFSVPIVDENRRLIYWVTFEGLLTYDPSFNNSKWRPWKKDSSTCQAVPELGPPYQDHQGNFWQICYDKDDDAFSYFMLSGDESDRADVDGGRFCSGVTCFSKSYEHWDKPWVKVDKNLYEKSRWARAPLLCLCEESKASITVRFGQGSNIPLLDIVKNRNKSHLTNMWIERNGELSIELKIRDALEICSPWELRLFIYQDHLFAYSVEKSVCHKWRLK